MEEVGLPSDGGIGRIGVGGRMGVDAEGAVGGGDEEGGGVGGGGLDLGRGGREEVERVVGVVHHSLPRARSLSLLPPPTTLSFVTVVVTVVVVGGDRGALPHHRRRSWKSELLELIYIREWNGG